ncbi:MAG: hypothetical protein IJT54_02695 [Candidatus Methanomethylophilaceae archaeon]|nr:hypothetical protein [Candidatus Methanomethylophilaceae archaeon]
MTPMMAKIGIIAVIIALAVYYVVAQPSPEDLGGAVGFLQENFAKICFGACIIGQFYSFLTRNTIRFVIFSGSLVVTWVLGW